MSAVSVMRMSWLLLTCLSIFSGLVSAHIGPVPAEYPSEKPSVSSGHEVYGLNCAGCHGDDGKGAAAAVDFTDQERMKNKNSSVFYEAISEGVSGTAMPAFGNLSISQRWDAVAYVWTFWADRESALRGKVIFEKRCASCHGIKGDGSELPGSLDFTNLSNMVSIGQPSVFFNSVSNGVPGTAMPPWRGSLSGDEIWDSVKYVWTFQYRDHPVQELSPVPEIPSKSIPWFRTPAGAAIVLISFVMAAGILYLFGKGVRER